METRKRWKERRNRFKKLVSRILVWRKGRRVKMKLKDKSHFKNKRRVWIKMRWDLRNSYKLPKMMRMNQTRVTR